MVLLVRGVIMAGVISLISADAVWAGSSTSDARPKWEAWSEIGGYAANRDGSQSGEVTLWAPLLQDGTSLFFGNIRAGLHGGDAQTGNFALGYRRMTNSGWNLGVWGAFDRRWTSSSKIFNQLATGFEALSPDWELRINGYLPLESRSLISTSTQYTDVSFDLQNDGLYMLSTPYRTQVADLAFIGATTEIGIRLPVEYIAPLLAHDVKSRPQHDLRLYMGGFYFENEHYGEDIIGSQLRTEWRINDIISDWGGSRLTFEAAYRHDDACDNDVRVGTSLRLPLGGARSQTSLDAQEELMTENLKRETNVLTRQVTETAALPEMREHVEDMVTNVALMHAVIVENGGDLQNSIDTIGSNSLIILLGGAETFDSPTMQANQTVLGGAGTVQVRGLATGTVANYTAPGTQPTSSGEDELTTANNSHVSGLTLSASHGCTISVGGNQTAVIDDVSIASGSCGIGVSGDASIVTVLSSTFESNDGIEVNGEHNELIVRNNIFNNSGAAVWFASENSSAEITGNIINSQNVGIFVQGSGVNMTVIGNVFDTKWENVYIEDGQVNIMMRGNTFDFSSGNYIFGLFSGSTTILDGSVNNSAPDVAQEAYCYVSNSATLTGEIDISGVTVVAGNCSHTY